LSFAFASPIDAPAACPRCAHGSRLPGPVSAAEAWRLVCPACERPLLSEGALAEISQLSEGDRCTLASALGEPMLAQLSELAHDLRVSTMGEMVAGLAHELNQPLYAITNYARSCENFLRQHAELQAEFRTLADKLVNQATRAAEIVKRLRRFASRREPRRTRLDVNALVREVEQLMLFHAKRFAIPVHVELAPDLPAVLGDSLLIEQVLVNLVRNSLEAINDNKPGDASLVTLRTARVGADALEIVVADNGPGFGVEHLEQLFEPYYTTKTSGMGLGLVISRSIVQAHGGTLTAARRPEGGAVFRMTLPVDAEEA
jgi:C4-dicarboxylate-specific signal transduction histidine kinase